MSANVTLTKRGEVLQSYLKRNFEIGIEKKLWPCNLKGTLNRNVKGTVQSQFKSIFKI